MFAKILSDINQPYYKENFPNDGQRFVAWYLRNIHNLDTHETKDCITDGAGDKQIDAVYIDNQSSTVFIIQGKFYGGDTIDAEPLREVLSSWIQIQDLARLQDGANQKLKIKVNEIATALEDDYEVCFELITTSALTNSAQHDLEIFQRELADDETFAANLVVVDNETLKFKYDEALNRNRPYINHEFQLEEGKYMELMIDGTKAVIAALSLRDCVKIPGIKDGSLFRKNVRQSLGAGNKVNKGIARTIKNNAGDFFFLHNGITAICSHLSIHDGILSAKELNVVNGCQSLSTIFGCSESAKKADNAYIMFRFYEISDTERADNISTSTNSQSAVKARDLRSNDKAVLALKKAYEQFYTDGYFVTKRGEKVDTVRYNTAHIVNLTDLGKQLIAWHSQRPNLSYGETKIFDKYFDQLFRREYSPENVQALNVMFSTLYAKWDKDNPMGLNETLLAMKAYAPYHQLYAISVIICEINKMNDSVPSPSAVLQKLKAADLLDTVVETAGICLNMALEAASSEALDNGKMFVPQNWIKSKTSLKDLRMSIKQYLASLRISSKQFLNQLNTALEMSKEDFSSRWTAD
ncbi:AIPR family protein [Hydrogeniiclostridium mannosilyticum]|uniref:AIPR protein n=1 Tax=Hydrogeniiclostridium mannosilyticum TaxID=2764322 RepID=A0A328UB54_9FIRM|nr:AIPR family protein [Hydrogeniiclostridium mannosilyticum]RAQ25521.1 AIPR protein [Hydrogeniiclostridium mannosilyticum]